MISQLNKKQIGAIKMFKTKVEGQKFIVVCGACQREYQVRMTEDQMLELNKPSNERRNIQDILRHIPVDVRELFVSGMCGKCFDDMLPDEEMDESSDLSQWFPK